MPKKIAYDSKVFVITRALLLSYIITGAALLLTALLMYKLHLGESIVSVLIILIYIISTFVAGIFTGKRIVNKKFLWGLLAGGAYFFLLVLVSLVLNHTLKDLGSHFATTFFLCAASGMLGGMLS